MDQNINPNQVPLPQNTPSPAPNPSSAPYGLKPQLPDFSDLFRSAWMQFKLNWQTFVGVLIIPFVISLVPVFMSDRLHSLSSGFSFIIIFSIFHYIIQILALIATLLVISGNVNPISMGSAYSKSFGLFLPFIWLLILTTLTTYGGVALLIIPGIVIGILLLFSTFAFFFDGKRGMSALTTSWYYIRNYKLATVGRIFLINLVFILASIVLGIISVFLGPVAPVLTGLLYVVYLPVGMIYTSSLYQTLKQIVPPPSAEDESKIAGKIKIFSVIGIIAIVGIIFTVGSFFNHLRQVNPELLNKIKEGLNQPADQINYQP